MKERERSEMLLFIVHCEPRRIVQRRRRFIRKCKKKKTAMKQKQLKHCSHNNNNLFGKRIDGGGANASAFKKKYMEKQVRIGSTKKETGNERVTITAY